MLARDGEAGCGLVFGGNAKGETGESGSPAGLGCFGRKPEMNLDASYK
jgi:hypothetical protein